MDNINLPTIEAKPCWDCFKAWPITKRKCSCNKKLLRLPTFVELNSKRIVFIPKTANTLREDGSYTFWLTPFLTYYGNRE